MLLTLIKPQCRPSTILYFSDSAPEGLQDLLSSRLPHTPKVIYAQYYSLLVLMTL